MTEEEHNTDPYKKVISDEEIPAFEDILKDGKEIVTSTTDHTDFVEKDQQKKTLKAIGVALGAIVVIGALIFGVYLLMIEKEDSVEEPISDPSISVTETPTDTPSSTGDTDKPVDPKTPLLSLIPEVSNVKPSEAKIEAGETSFITTSGIIASFSDAKITGADADCIVTNTSDFCYAGTVKIEDNTAQVYYLKDAAHSRFFENPENFKKVEVQGAEASATMNVSISSEEKQTILVVVFEDMSGVMITFDDNSSINTFISSITIG